MTYKPAPDDQEETPEEPLAREGDSDIGEVIKQEDPKPINQQSEPYEPSQTDALYWRYTQEL